MDPPLPAVDREAWEVSEGSADETRAAVLASQLSLRRRRHYVALLGAVARRRRRGGSVPGRRPNRPRGFDAGFHSILRDYFGVDGCPPVYGEADFETRFRVPRNVFMEIYDDVKDLPYWKRTVNATGQPQAHGLQKVVAAFRVLAYGEAADRPDEYLRLAKSTTAVATQMLVDHIVDNYECSYLRPPTLQELAHILDRNAARGMPGCMGSIDCSHWAWRMCPKALAGQYQDYKKRRSVVMETVCDEDLFIWHFFVGPPGSHNDLNVWGQSPLCMDITSGQWPPDMFEYTLNGRTRRLLYYLADGVYPHFPFFARPFSRAANNSLKRRTYNRLQEALRKDVERLYGVLTARFHILLRPAKFHSVDRIVRTAKAVAILHNMVVINRRDGYLSRRRIGDAFGEPGAAASTLAAAAAAALAEAAGSGTLTAGPAGASGGSGGAAAAGSGALVAGTPCGPVGARGAGRVVAGGGSLGGRGGAEAVDGRGCRSGHPDDMQRLSGLRSPTEHERLREDLVEHIWAHRKNALAPYLHRHDDLMR